MQREMSTLKHHFRLGFVTVRASRRCVVIEKSHFILVVNLLSLLTVLVVPLCVLPFSWILHEIPLLELLKIYGENCVEREQKENDDDDETHPCFWQTSLTISSCFNIFFYVAAPLSIHATCMFMKFKMLQSRKRKKKISFLFVL